ASGPAGSGPAGSAAAPADAAPNHRRRATVDWPAPRDGPPSSRNRAHGTGGSRRARQGAADAACAPVRGKLTRLVWRRAAHGIALAPRTPRLPRAPLAPASPSAAPANPFDDESLSVADKIPRFRRTSICPVDLPLRRSRVRLRLVARPDRQ